MNIKEIAFVVYGVNNMKESRAFYENVLNLVPTSVWGDDASGFVEYELGPHTLAIGAGSENFKPSKGGGCAALEVEDFEAAMKHLKDAGCTFIMEGIETPACHMALIADPSGNTVMIHRRKAA